MKITPVKGCADYPPADAALRDFLFAEIIGVYKKSGFLRIYTPILEDAENLENSEGGENLALIFKVLKRGDKLQKALEQGGELSDMGLRYDLTLPLARFYANMRDKLILPFKCIQADRVYRAEQPQKGRMREFTQCDIDIIGSDSRDCETEIILVTAKALAAVGFADIIIKVNDRALMNGALLTAGINESDLPAACIALDKISKIGRDKVYAELREKGADTARIDKMLDADLPYFAELPGCEDAARNLSAIIDSVNKLLPENTGAKIQFDFSLTRGQGYYTGPVFEIQSGKYKSSIAGGGRYDNMIGKFLGERVPAVGFSIGFERIFDILRADGGIKSDADKKIILFYNEGAFEEAYKTAQPLENSYSVAIAPAPKKLGKALTKLEEAGYAGFMVQGRDEAPRFFS